MAMAKRKHHIVPQVYLKGFGFKKPEYNNKWFVSVKARDRSGWQDREIKKFLVEKDLYSVPDTLDFGKEFIEDNLHGKIENRIPSICQNLLTKNEISQCDKFIIAETVSNLLCRSKSALQWLKNMIDLKEDELIDFITHENYIFDNQESIESFRQMVNSLNNKDKVNLYMVQFMQRIKITLLLMKITIFRCTGDFLLFTSDHPVVIDGAGYGELSKGEAQVFCPIDKYNLIYFYWDKNHCPINSIHDLFIDKTIQIINKELIEYFSKNIMKANPSSYIIAPCRIDRTGSVI